MSDASSGSSGPQFLLSSPLGRAYTRARMCLTDPEFARRLDDTIAKIVADGWSVTRLRFIHTSGNGLVGDAEVVRRANRGQL